MLMSLKNQSRPVRLLLASAAACGLLIACAGAPVDEAGAARSVERSLASLRKGHKISKHRARWATSVYRKARATSARLEKPIRGSSPRARSRRESVRPRRAPLRWHLKNIEKMARSRRITADRVAPLFTTLSNNARWFRHNGPAAAGTDRRFGNSRIIFQYFPGTGWQFHPLSNFAKLNAVWTVDTPPARRAQREYARELIHWGVFRGSALTWEYYFDYSGSKAPWVSAISQGTAMQALARIAYRMHNRSIMRAARLAGRSFMQAPERGVQKRRDGGYHFLGYSGAPKLLILNMFIQSLNGMRTYYVLAKDRKMRKIYRRGLVAAKAEAPMFDTGSWSLYSLSGEKSNLHYHLLTIKFLHTLCRNSRVDAICDVRDKFKSYVK